MCTIRESLKTIRTALQKSKRIVGRMSGYIRKRCPPAPPWQVQFLFCRDNLPQIALQELYDHIATAELSGCRVKVDRAPADTPSECLWVETLLVGTQQVQRAEYTLSSGECVVVRASAPRDPALRSHPLGLRHPPRATLPSQGSSRNH